MKDPKTKKREQRRDDVGRQVGKQVLAFMHSSETAPCARGGKTCTMQAPLGHVPTTAGFVLIYLVYGERARKSKSKIQIRRERNLQIK